MKYKKRDSIQGDALLAIRNRKLSGIEISMGVGKTLIGLKDMAAGFTDISKNLVVAPKKSIFTSWLDDMDKFHMHHLKQHTEFVTYRSLAKQAFDFDTVYLDECHSLKATHNGWLKEFVRRGGRVVGLTGTYPIYRNTEKGKMCNFYCPKVYEYKTDDAVADKILNDYTIVIHKLRLNEKSTLPRTGKHGDFKTSEAKEYNYWTQTLDEASSDKQKQICSIQRMKSMQKFPSKLNYARLLFESQTNKTIVFANTQEQADHLCDYSYHSNNDDSEFNLTAFKKNITMHLSAVEQLNEGVNIPNLKIGIIMHAYANNRKTAQKIGRLLRLNPDDKATVHVLCYENSVDKQWVKQALKGFDPSKIKWIDPVFNITQY